MKLAGATTGPRSPGSAFVTWGGTCLLALVLSFELASGEFIGVAIVLGSLAGLLAVLSGTRTLSILWLVGSPTGFVFINNTLHVIPAFTMERAMFLLLAGLLLAQAALGKTPLALDRAEKWMAGFLLVALASLLTMAGRRPLALWLGQDVALLVQTYLMPLGSYFIARRLIWGATPLRWLAWCLVGAGTFLAFTAALQVLLGFMTFVPTYMEVIHSQTRATGVFNNATEYGMVLNACLLFALMLYLRTRDGLSRALLLLASVAMVGAILLSKTRAPMVGLLLSLGYVFMHDPRARPLLRRALVLACLAGVAAAPFLLGSEVLEKRIADPDPIYNRIAGAATALNMVVHNPLLGVGFQQQAFGENREKYQIGFAGVGAEWSTQITVPHNEHLNVAVLTGLLGFVLYVGVFRTLFRGLRQARDRAAVDEPAHELGCLAGALLVIYLSNGFVVDFPPNIYIGLLTFFAAGMAASLDLAGRTANSARPGAEAPGRRVS